MPERRHCRHCLGGWNGKHSRQFTWQLLLTRKWWHRVFRGEGGLMLLSFRVANVLSFRDEQSLFFVATEFHDGPALPTEVREQGKKIAVLPVLGIYGANASGRAIGRPSGRSDWYEQAVEKLAIGSYLITPVYLPTARRPGRPRSGT
jgi:hypothetical protein